MESYTTKLGSTLTVPNVQELAKEKLTSISPRYIRPDPTNIRVVSSDEIPVVDMQRLLSDGLVNLEREKLHFACKEWGFFQLINHGVSSSLVEKLKLEIQNFFNLTIEEKMRFGQEGEIEGYGHAFVVSEEQKLDWSDILFIFTLPTHMRKPDLIPKLSVPFREAIEEYSAEMKTLAVKVLDQMAKALGMKPEDMRMLFEEGLQSMRMNYYPPCPRPDLVMGLCSHTDAVGLTILLQVNEAEGLQVKKDGTWVPVVPLPNALIVNIGDILEIVTNGIYKSLAHRATVNSHNERLSIATFLVPNLDGEMGPAPSLITPENPANFKRIGMMDYLRKLFARELNGRAFVDAMKISSEQI